MEQQRIEQLRQMIQSAEFLNDATKQVFLAKIPELNERKFEDLYEVFAHDLKERQKLKQKKVEIFEKYKATVTGIYQKAKQFIIGLKEKTITKIDEKELSNLDQELSNL